MEILALGGDRFAGELDDRLVIGDFALALPLALRSFVVLAPGFFDLVVDRRIAEVFSAGIVAGNGIEDIFPKRHCPVALCRGRFLNREFDLAHFKQRELFAIDEKQLLSNGNGFAALDFLPMRLAAKTHVIVGLAEERGYRTGISTSPNSVSLNDGPVRTSAGTHSRSRSFDGACISIDTMCSKGIHMYAPAANNSSRAPIRGSRVHHRFKGLPVK